MRASRSLRKNAGCGCSRFDRYVVRAVLNTHARARAHNHTPARAHVRAHTRTHSLTHAPRRAAPRRTQSVSPGVPAVCGTRCASDPPARRQHRQPRFSILRNVQGPSLGHNYIGHNCIGHTYRGHYRLFDTAQCAHGRMDAFAHGRTCAHTDERTRACRHAHIRHGEPDFCVITL